MLRGALAAGAAGACPSLARAFAAPRSLSLLNLHTGEKLQAEYFDGARYLPDALGALNRLLRDHRTGEVHAITPGVLDIASRLSSGFGPRREVHIISGYRSPATNARLHEASQGVATRSLHMQGQALDIRVPGVDLSRLHAEALALGAGGVGFYPTSNFVHVDIGRVRRWQGA